MASNDEMVKLLFEKYSIPKTQALNIVRDLAKINRPKAHAERSVLSFFDAVAEMEYLMILLALSHSKGHKTKAAEFLHFRYENIIRYITKMKEDGRDPAADPDYGDVGAVMARINALYESSLLSITDNEQKDCDSPEAYKYTHPC